MAGYLPSEAPGCIAHAHELRKRIAKRRYVVELPMDRQFIGQEIQMSTPAGEVIHIFVELIEKALRPTVDVASGV